MELNVSRAAERRWLPVVLRIVAGVAAASAACGVLKLFDATLEIAAVSLFLVVVGSALLGYAAGFAAAATGFVLLLYAFTPPIGQVVVRHVADLLVGVSFFLGATAVGFVVARINDLRRRSERLAREAELRLLVTGRLLGDAPFEELIGDVSNELVGVLGVDTCRIDTSTNGGQRGGAEPDRDTTDTSDAVVAVVAGDVRITVTPGRRGLDRQQRDLLEEVAGVLSLALDRLRLGDAARASTLQADIARSRAAFLTAITHDLRTPLSTIRAATAALLLPDSQLDDREREELLELARDESHDLERLLGKVLDLTRIRSGAVDLTRVRASPADLASAAVRRVRTLDRRHSVQVEMDDAIGPIDVDVVMMEQVLANLIENASLHSGDPEPIRVSATQERDAIEFRVVDHGRGVDPVTGEKIFDEFVRAGSDGGRGMGLGLAIVRHLVELHDGTVWHERTHGGGATFVVRIPSDSAA